ncbi:hypothetical protein [Cohnella panacarvi]|nr:hypothetical protein [Cohnella panacarvi]
MNVPTRDSIWGNLRVALSRGPRYDVIPASDDEAGARAAMAATRTKW